MRGARQDDHYPKDGEAGSLVLQAPASSRRDHKTTRLPAPYQ